MNSLVHSREALVPGADLSALIAKLSPRLLDALSECQRHNDSGLCYWWRTSSMRLLEERCLVAKWTPNSVAQRPRMKARPWKVTDLGRAVLKAHASRTVEGE